MAKPKTDKRKNNGAENRGMTEDQQLVRGPREIIEQMRQRAKVEGVPISELWRKAAAQYLKA